MRGLVQTFIDPNDGCVLTSKHLERALVSVCFARITGFDGSDSGKADPHCTVGGKERICFVDFDGVGVDGWRGL